MKNFMYILCCAFVVGLAYWAYTENYSTQASVKRVQTLQAQIAKEREAIAVLNAEWAYLNRPDRLRELADMNFERLGLVPLSAQHFGSAEWIQYPDSEANTLKQPIDVNNIVETVN